MAKAIILLLFFLCGNASWAQTTTSAASQQYSDASFLRRLVIGTNYRKEWSTPVQLPVFHLKESGYTIKELGGGMQTKSLRLEDKKGKEWVLRTVDKDVTPNLPGFLRGTFAHQAVQDMISAGHPYAPLTVPPLAEAIGIAVSTPTFYYIPDDAALGNYRSIFANTVCMLEEREPTPDGSETKNTPKVLEDLLAHHDDEILQKQVLKARLLDMLIADWDRHADQWRWGKIDSANIDQYYAIPRDRDQAYFLSNGLLLRFTRVFALKHMVGFNKHFKNITALNWKSWKFDRTFINRLDKNDWQSVVDEVQAGWTDKVIDEAVKKMPPEIYPISGPVIAEKLKNRRNLLQEAALNYYDFLSHKVTVIGSDDAEHFSIKKAGEHLLVEVTTPAGRNLYRRVVRANETQELVFTGLGGKDRFVVADNVRSKLKLSIDGGRGADVYDIKGNLRTKIRDNKKEPNELLHTRRTKMIWR